MPHNEEDEINAALRGDDVESSAGLGRILAGAAVLLSVVLFTFLAVSFTG